MKIPVKQILQILLILTFQLNLNNCPAQQTTSISNVKLKDRTEKIFFDANANILKNGDTVRAKFYRVINYREGKIYGPVTDYFNNGKIYMTGYYKDNIIGKGHENGEFIYYFESGATFQIRNYVNGALDGVVLEFYTSGSKKASVSFSKGKKYGCEYAWDENGKIIRTAFNENGQSYNRAECDIIEKKESVVEPLQQPNTAQISTSPNNNSSSNSNQQSNALEKKFNTIYNADDLKLVEGLIDLNQVEMASKEFFIGEFRHKTIMGKSKMRFVQAKEFDEILIGYSQRGNKPEIPSIYMYYKGILFYRSKDYVQVIRKLQNGIGFKWFILSPLSSLDEIYYER